jgi:hypothetical protein
MGRVCHCLDISGFSGCGSVKVMGSKGWACMLSEVAALFQTVRLLLFAREDRFT